MENLGSIILATRDRILQLVDFVFAQKIDEESPSWNINANVSVHEVDRMNAITYRSQWKFLLVSGNVLYSWQFFQSFFWCYTASVKRV